MPSLWVTTAEGTLVPLEAEGYANEKDFQKLLAENPAVLAAALDGEEAGGWLLVDRELPIKAEESEFGTWSVDHLFVGADGTPILVEVKRSSDPRADGRLLRRCSITRRRSRSTGPRSAYATGGSGDQA